jgi:Holliday junction resolvase RusA-like endonuclease
VKVSFFIPGKPQGKGRPRFVRKTGHTYTPDTTVKYEDSVRKEYKEQCENYRFPDGAPLKMRIDAYFEIPKRANKLERLTMASGVAYPIKKPDADNIMKIVLDSLNGVAYKDDVQIVGLSLAKRYAALARTSVEIEEATS